MLPVIAIVGRPNVGKSTLFNALTRSRDALVADRPGLTRDRRYGIWRTGSGNALLVDTGGLTGDSDTMARLIASQAHAAIEEAELLALVVDAREGVTASDEILAAELRRTAKPVVLVLNKIDRVDPDTAAAEFHALGLGDPLGVSATQRRGLHALWGSIQARLPARPDDGDAEDEDDSIAVCVIGRPNVGKSTLVNRLVGEERVVAHDLPGTTRDSIRVPFTRDERRYVLIDTAGIRRRARVNDVIEKFSVVKSLQAIEQSDVAMVMLDASAGVTDQDVSLLGLVLDQGRAVTIVLNKWDTLSSGERRQLRSELARKTAFAAFCPVVVTSALQGSGMRELLSAVDRCHSSAFPKLPTNLLSRILEDAQEHRPPPLARGRRIKLRYAHQGGSNPPVIVIHGNQTQLLPEHYRRYLSARFREALDLVGAPVDIQLRTGDNPFKGRKNTLTPRQERRRKRLIRHVRTR